jgi:organic radical activating enzyme
MENIFQSIRNLFSPIKPLPAGIYHYTSPAEDPRNYRLHLRIEKDGSGILVLNASSILHLNQTAAEYAYYAVQNLSADGAAQQVAARYHVTPDSARQDYQNFTDRLQILINSPDLDPETFLDFQRKTPHRGYISAPYRLDCALSYLLPTGTDPAFAPIERVKSELSTQQWKNILKIAWDAGIPHIVFTGGEPTLRTDLVELIAFAESQGQVTGLVSDGSRLADREYTAAILQSGLDHLMLVFQPLVDDNWKILKNLLAEDLFITIHLTISQHTFSQVPSTIQQLADYGVRAVSLSTDDPALKTQVDEVRNLLSILLLSKLHRQVTLRVLAVIGCMLNRMEMYYQGRG